jgi:2-polyprenyl-6-methoxyphenol hydroxylase-like FAD-dependent oxidoreductase
LQQGLLQKAGTYEVKNWAPHKIHQRCASSFRVGRLLLAADAAHVCNPFGGLGITGGFVDVGGLYDCLAGIWHGKADPSILDTYSEKRREIWYNIIDAVSQENFRRVTERDAEEKPPRDVWEKFVGGVDNDPELRKKLLMTRLGIRYDFTQHYHSHQERARL